MPPSPTYERRMDNSPSADGTVKKRRKGATRLSCAECRRLKLRCDRAIPCSSCVKRGCGAICPDGSLTTGQGNRFVLASTQELHEKISELATRVRELEDALRASHSHLSTEPHPLLSEELLKIKAPLQRDINSIKPSAAVTVKEEEQNPDVVDAFGSLSIALSGKTKYFGQTANSVNELPEEEEEDDHLISLQNILPPEILNRASSFPISHYSVTGNVGLQTLYWYLPPAEVAQELRAIYYTYAAWMYHPVNVETFDTEIYPAFYNQTIGPIPDEPLLAHKLSILFMILAIGSLMNQALPAYNLEAEKYHQLARAALFHHSFFDIPTINAVQALYLMTHYLFIDERHGTSSGARWATMGLAVKVAQSIGLHRDSGKWKVDPVETARRRELFWELFTYDSWQSFTFSRPPSFFPPHLDCKMPHLENPSDEQSFNAWKHRFASECMTLLHDQAFGAKMPTYATVLQLDRKLRAFPVPPILQVAGFGNSEPRQGGYPDSVMLTLQRHIVLAIREMNLLYLHRSFFARAISDHPKDPLGSPYGTSVIAAYRSAGSLVAMMRNLHTQLKEPSERMWFLWTHMFSCSIILGSIVTRCPSMSLAPSALVQLDSACELFSKAARGFRANKVLSIMLHLQEKAHFSLDEFRRGKGSPLTRYNPSSGPITPDADDDELSVLGGKTRLVSKKEPSSPILMERSPVSQNPIVPLPLSPGLHNNLPESVREYLDSFKVQGGQSQQQQSVFNNHSSNHNSFNSNQYSDASEISPVSMYGMSAMPTSFQSEPSSFLPQQSMQNMMQAGQGSSTAMDTSNSQNESNFPQYFPVYDYGLASSSSGFQRGSGSGSMFTQDQPLVLDTSPGPAHRKASGSPEGHSNMQTTWLDFVNTMAMQ
ncbi:putative transcriptional regulatory protein C1F7.11c [Psilocybe cubensis]|uniref:Zn(2)-C6 fungal-type domain-containing protein n=2 Tax=Psilocybe cubensis TaxID=181762 RepID=A0A8H7XVS4_PSICU|nr:putative transcriptional regulatory protein C1F7.11c [Psilocybe cubensis]KAH9479629.1 putative transcriptional regulatory protein C1F7.11c [Psilocybe cubensis]